ncbi:MAG: intermembrane transport protein PqiB [Pseudomonadota bacterium]
MSEPEGPHLATPEVRRSRTISLVWLVPLAALAVGLWLVIDAWREQGPVVTLELPNAEGLEAGQTRVRLLDVDVGLVTALDVADGLDRVIATVEMDRDARDYLRGGTRFWVVRPRVGAGGVSGLSTLLSGSYIAVAPGEGERTMHFVALSSPPPVVPVEPGRTFVLTTGRLGGVARGSGVYYRGLRVGQITDYRLLDGDRGVEIDLFVREEAADRVRIDSRFWLANGITFGLSGAGVRVEMTSLEAFLAGGVAFRSPADSIAPVAAAGQRFRLFANEQDAEDAGGAHSVVLLAAFDGNVGGLREGSPVLFRGVRVGRVADVHFEFVSQTGAIRALVRFELFRQDLLIDGASPLLEARELLDRLVQRGLRARLATVNFVTGELAIGIDEVADAAPAAIDWTTVPPTFPTAPGSFDQLQATLQEVLTAFADLPMEELTEDVRRILGGAAEALSRPELTTSIVDAGTAAAGLAAIVRMLEGELPTILGSIESTVGDAEGGMAELRASLVAARGVLERAERLMQGAETVPYDTQRLLQELRLLTRSLTSFVDYLERNPEALLRGRR